MINIISKSIYQYHPSGPKKVVEGLIKGLEKAGIPYALNKDPLSAPYTWIHDDLEAICYLEENRKRNLHGQAHQTGTEPHYVFGPNIAYDPASLEKFYPGITAQDSILHKGIYIAPSQWVKDFWKKRTYSAPMEIWPVGVDTDIFAPIRDHMNKGGDEDDQIKKGKKVLVYTKGRAKEDIDEITNFLHEQKIEYQLISYGSYTEKELRDAAHHSRYGIIIASSESQGLAIEELLAMDLPLIVFDIDFINQKSWKEKDALLAKKADPASSIPYFDNRCGLIGKNPEDIKKHIASMEKSFMQINQFSPREFILEHLTQKKQALALCTLLQYPIDQPIKAAKYKNWRNRTWHRPTLMAKYILQYIRWKLF